jgi:hypothetical protein
MGAPAVQAAGVSLRWLVSSASLPSFLPAARSATPPLPGILARTQIALSSSRVTPVTPGPALRPRWCPAHSPSSVQDGCLPPHAKRRRSSQALRNILADHHDTDFGAPSRGLYPHDTRLHTPMTETHAGSLLTCWLGVGQMGLERIALTHWVTTASVKTSRQSPRFRLSLARACRGSVGYAPHPTTSTP